MSKDKKPTIIIDDAIDTDGTHAKKMRRELLEWFDEMINLRAIKVPRIPTTFRTPSVWEERELWSGIDYAANHSSDYTALINPEGSHTASVLTPYHVKDLLKELEPISMTRGPATIRRDEIQETEVEMIAMATRAECKFCGETVKVNRDGTFAAHGFARVKGVQRLDKKCKGSGMDAMKASKGPFNDVRPCSECAMPVVIGSDESDGGKVLCIICLDKKPRFEKYGCCDCGGPITPEYFERENDAGWVLCESCKAKTPEAEHVTRRFPVDKSIQMCECGALIDVAKEGVPCRGCTVEKPCADCGTPVTVAKEAPKSFKVLCSTCYIPQPGDEIVQSVDKKRK